MRNVVAAKTVSKKSPNPLLGSEEDLKRFLEMFLEGFKTWQDKNIIRTRRGNIVFSVCRVNHKVWDECWLIKHRGQYYEVQDYRFVGNLIKAVVTLAYGG